MPPISECLCIYQKGSEGHSNPKAIEDASISRRWDTATSAIIHMQPAK